LSPAPDLRLSLFFFAVAGVPFVAGTSVAGSEERASEKKSKHMCQAEKS
jgi:hypothetical protein